jgi:acetyl-CoA carboxylase biotin carboxyl carrier protein
MDLTYEDVLNILRIIDQSSCEELHLELGDLKLIIRKSGGNAAPTVGSSERGIEGQASQQLTATPTVEPREQTGSALDSRSVVSAPMVGVFYRAPSPGAQPFVEVGSVVDKNDTVCLIEVMKLLTAIKAGCRGRVVEICATNGALVEYGEPLMVIMPIS